MLTASESKSQLALAEKTYVGDLLNLDLWVQSVANQDSSMLIRKTTPYGQTTSVLLHIVDRAIKVIPNFTSSAGGALLGTDQNQMAAAQRPQQSAARTGRQRRRFLPAFEYLLLLLGVTFLIFSATGIFQTRVILTGSMQPTLNPGDVVFTIAPKVLKPEIGKTVIYTARDLSGNPVTQWAHRIIAGDPIAGWTIKGDANPTADVNLVAAADISGVVLFSLPFIGKFLNPLTLIIFAAGLLVLILLVSKLRE